MVCLIIEPQEDVFVLADERLDGFDHQAEGFGGLLVEAVELSDLSGCRARRPRSR